MNRFIRYGLIGLVLLGLLSPVSYATTVTDVTTSKNQITLKGPNPHALFSDTDFICLGGSNNGNTCNTNADCPGGGGAACISTGVFQIQEQGGVLAFSSIEQGNNIASPPVRAYTFPVAGAVGVLISPPGSFSVTSVSAGGSVPVAPNFFVVTASDGNGQTLASQEQTCNVVSGGTQTCNLSWNAVSVATGIQATTYVVYRGLGAGAESVHKVVACGTSTCTTAYDGTSEIAGAPPTVASAMAVRLTSSGIFFVDGSQLTSASSSSTWGINSTTNLYSLGTHVGIGTGTFASGMTEERLNLIAGSGSNGGINLGNIGWIRPATNSLKLSENVRPSTGQQWDNTNPSWSIDLGTGSDHLNILHAPATVGAISEVSYLTIDGTTGTVHIPNSLIVGSLPLSTALVTATSNAPVNNIIVCNVRLNVPITITLPNSSTVTAGTFYIIKNPSGVGSTQTCTIQGFGGTQTIDGVTTSVLSVGQSLRIFTRGAVSGTLNPYDWYQW